MNKNSNTILFLNHCGELGGAEISLADVAKPYAKNCLVILFMDGPFRKHLESQGIKVKTLGLKSIPFQRSKNIENIIYLPILIIIFFCLIIRISIISQKFDLIYANTPKSLIIGALPSYITRRPLIYHLHDLLSSEHFSRINIFILISIINIFSSSVITNSNATRDVFLKAGGRSEIAEVIFCGFDLNKYNINKFIVKKLRNSIKFKDKFIVGNFSRLHPIKGQNLLIEAISKCPQEIVAIIVGGSLFNQQPYTDKLYQQVKDLKLEERVHFLGFCSNIPELMSICDLIVHTSVAPEPFGRVIAEGMLSQRVVVAPDAGGIPEMLEHGKTGYLFPQNDVQQLSKIITTCCLLPHEQNTIAQNAESFARNNFNLGIMQKKIHLVLLKVLQEKNGL